LRKIKKNFCISLSLQPAGEESISSTKAAEDKVEGDVESTTSLAQWHSLIGVVIGLVLNMALATGGMNCSRD
jgi:hypothetical protein